MYTWEAGHPLCPLPWQGGLHLHRPVTYPYPLELAWIVTQVFLILLFTYTGDRLLMKRERTMYACTTLTDLLHFVRQYITYTRHAIWSLMQWSNTNVCNYTFEWTVISREYNRDPVHTITRLRGVQETEEKVMRVLLIPFDHSGRIFKEIQSLYPVARTPNVISFPWRVETIKTTPEPTLTGSCP